jgi:hypothetical protein
MHTLRNAAISIAALYLSITLLTPFSLRGNSAYNYITGTLYCKTRYECIHEVGHRMDGDLGKPSKSRAFADILRLYVQTEFMKGPGVTSDMTYRIIYFPGVLEYSRQYSPLGIEIWSSPQEELYASMFAWADGDISQIPDAFRSFYSADPKYHQLQECLTGPGWLHVCGVNISLLSTH